MIDIARRHVCSAGAIWRALLAAAVGLIALVGISPLGSEAGASHDICDYDNPIYDGARHDFDDPANLSQTSTATPSEGRLSGATCGIDFGRSFGHQRLTADFVAPRPTSGFIDPGDVRFSQADASLNFSNGGNVSDLSAGLRSGAIDPSDVPPIRLAEIDGQLFTLDNRRLIAFGDAGVPVPYRMATPDEIAVDAFKFTTTNGGTSIQLRLFSPFRYQGGPR